MFLHNRVNKEELKKRLLEEPFKRRTISFYRYVIIENPRDFRDQLYQEWFELNCFGRIYFAREGVNAQMSVPGNNLEFFLQKLDRHPELKDMLVKYAIEDDGKSFYKLTLKVRPKIVADGLDDRAFDVTDVGKHLSALEFHELVQQEDTVVIDMRNHYESEVGRFEGAVCPDADTFRDEIQMVVDDFADQKDQKFLLYCTGGIRCEKASAYLRHHGFKDVNQLHGGVIEYAQQIKKLNLKSKFVGKNFVFDERLGESVDGQVIGRCHQCGKPADTHVNCANQACHLLFIQCDECKKQYNGCCSQECKEILTLPAEQQKEMQARLQERFAQNKIFKSRYRPDFNKQFHAEAGILKKSNGW